MLRLTQAVLRLHKDVDCYDRLFFAIVSLDVGLHVSVDQALVAFLLGRRLAGDGSFLVLLMFERC